MSAGLFAPVTSSPVTCTAVAPVALKCDAQIQFRSSGRGVFDDDSLLLFDLKKMTVAFYPKRVSGGYDFSNPANRCTTAFANGCDGTYGDTYVQGSPYVQGEYFLAVRLEGTVGPAGKWGWTWVPQ